MDGVVDDSLRGTNLGNLPQVHDCDPVRHVARDGNVMGDEEEWNPVFVPEIEHQVHHASPDGNVQHRDGLVRDNHLWVNDQCPRNCHSLPLTPTKFVRIAVKDILGGNEPGVLDGLRHNLQPLLDGLTDAVYDQGLRDGLEYGESGIQRFVRVLEDHLHVLPKIADCTPVQVGNVISPL